GLEGGRGRDAGQLLEALAQLDHVGLGASRAPPDGAALRQTGDGDGEERRREEPADARNGRRAKRRWLGHATATNRGTSRGRTRAAAQRDRKSTRLNSSHQIISYAVFCLKNKQRVTVLK